MSSDTSSDDEDVESDSEDSSESDSEVTSDTDEESTSESEELSESEHEKSAELETPDQEAVRRVAAERKHRPIKTSAPGSGSSRTKKNNQRCKLRRRLSKLKQFGALSPEADFAALRNWESANGTWYQPPKMNGVGTEDICPDTSAKQQQQLEFEEKRQTLLTQLESGGINIDGISEEGRVSSIPREDTQDPAGGSEELGDKPVDKTTAEIESEPLKRRTLDLASSRRLLFGSLGVRTPRSKEDEEATRKKLAHKTKQVESQRQLSEPDSSLEAESHLDETWQDKLVVGATECIFDDIELSAPPFPFEQRWDSEACGIIRQRKGMGKKRKRRRAQAYEEENWEKSYENGDIQLNYSDHEPTNGDQHADDVVEVDQNSGSQSPSEDLPILPEDLGSVPDLVESAVKPGSIIAYKQLDMSRATNWQPLVSEYRVAKVLEILEDGVAKIELAKRDRTKSSDSSDEDDGPREYSGFEMPGLDDGKAADDGFREVLFGELIDPKLLQPADYGAAAADAAEPEDAQGTFMSVN